MQKESKVLYKRRGNKPTLKDRRRQRNEGRGERETGEGKKEQKAGESKVMPLSRQEASLMGRKQFICAGKRSREEMMNGPQCGAEKMHSTHQKGEEMGHFKDNPQCPSQGHCSEGTLVCITLTQPHTSEIQQATDNKGSA